MGEERKDKLKTDEEEEERYHSGFLTFFLTLAAVLLVVLLAAYRDGTGFDVLRRYLNYGAAEKAEDEIIYDYDASAKNRYAVLGENLLVLSDTSFSLLDKHGGEIWKVTVNMSAPALSCGGGRAVAYDVGGTTLYLADESGIIWELSAAEDEPFIAASLNEDRYLAITSEKKGFKGSVSVYNNKLSLAYVFDSSRRFVLDACVVNNTLAVVTLGQENGVFVSNVVLYHMPAEESAADYNISGGLVSAIGEQDRKIVTVSDTCLTYASMAGEVQATYTYKGSYLREFALEGDGFAALLLNRYRSGSVGQLVTVDSSGKELGSLEVREEVLDISASGRYLAVLYSNHLVIYNDDLQAYATLQETDYAREVLMRSDGSALLLSSESASLYLP
ncbi:MAG: hypothetical protein HFF84_02720 [Oscillibacter sp.]|nr:hypothetical protein [Oscillibacter sp.]